MEDHHVDALALSLTGVLSRRGIVRGLAVLPLELAARVLPGRAAGRRKRKRREKHRENKNCSNSSALQLNEFQCVDVGNACRGDSANCCSGICQGKKPKKGKRDTSVCLAHNTATCQTDEDVCAGTGGSCGVDGLCFRTTGTTSFCGTSPDPAGCIDCTKDADCEPIFGLGAACVTCGGACGGSGILCIGPATV
jgi:hypothetical protein